MTAKVNGRIFLDNQESEFISEDQRLLISSSIAARAASLSAGF